MAKKKKEKVVLRTTVMNGHSHTYSPGDEWTSVEHGHRHPVRKGRGIGTRKRCWIVKPASGHDHHTAGPA